MMDRRRNGSFDWITFLLLCALVLVSSWVVIATEWVDHLNIIALISLLGASFGTALARTRFPGWLATLIAAYFGAFISGWQLGNTLDHPLPWSIRIENATDRVSELISKLLMGEPNNDPFIFVILMATLFWVLSAWAGWSIFRRQAAWSASLPLGLTIAVVINYYYGEARLGIFLAILGFLTLILAARVHIMGRSTTWEQQRARVPIDTIYRVSISSLLLAVAIVAIAWGGPAFARSESLSNAWRTITRPFDTVQEGFEDAFDSIEGPIRLVPSEYGEVLNLSAGSQPVNRLVMIVDPIQSPSTGGRFYWRSRVYDQYVDNQWLGLQPEPEDFDPDLAPFSLGEFQGREMIEAQISPIDAAIKLLYLPSQPIWVDRAAGIQLVRHNDDSLDVLSVESDRYVREGESYFAMASLAAPSADQLRDAGEVYPAWVLDRNLQIPDTISQRTRDLALEITAGLESPFDKAVAITRWLRDNMEYERVIEAPPADREPIDWFLFEHKIGFCNYYASAEVIMLRTLGIPARMAGGYAQGIFNSLEGVYEVYGEDSHAWPEVFFPGIGWVEFEPTVSQPVLERPETADSEGIDPAADSQQGDGLGNVPEDEERLPEEAGSEAGATQTEQDSRAALLQSIGYLVLGLVLVGMVWVRINPSSWAAVKGMVGRLAQQLELDLPETTDPQRWDWETYTGRVYAAWSAWLQRLGLSRGPSETASERILAFIHALPDSAAEGQILVESYVNERFGGQKVDETEVRKAWRSLQPRLWLAWAWKLTERWRAEKSD